MSERSEPPERETVIGLEVHCELRTQTKLFCACRNAFGDEPNTNVSPVSLGLPGSLPELNRQGVVLAMRIGAALHCEVRPSIFHRKNYFYPDMPKDYQISQYDLPINVDGWLELPDGARVGIERAHLEEDTGKTTHVGTSGRIHGADFSLVDYNRAGVPLVEIVSRPDIRGPEQARAYVTELRSILVATGASDGKMEEGSLRVDANISVHHPGEPYGTRCEIKNLNSLRSLGRAIEYEVRRQTGILDDGGTVVQETRHWNEDEGRTSSLRSKEEAYDYRYFPEPDLVPLDPPAFGRQGGQRRTHRRLPRLRRIQRDEIGLGEVPVVVGLLLRAQRGGPPLVLVPVPRLLHHAAPVLEDRGLPPDLVLDGAAERPERVEVLDLAARPVRLAGTVQADVGVDAQAPFLHLAVGRVGGHQDRPQLGHVGPGLLRTAEVWAAHDLDQRNAGAVVVDEGEVGAVDAAADPNVGRLARVLLEVRTFDADPRAVGELQPPVDVERKVVLADLVVLGHVGIEVVLAVEDRRPHLAVQGRADPHGQLDGLAVEHGQ